MDRRLCKGFSLLELVMVLAIMIIAAGIVGPNIVTFMDIWKAEGKAREMAGHLREMRQRSLARQEWCGIFLDMVDGLYDVRCSSNQGGSWNIVRTVDLRPEGLTLVIQDSWDPPDEITFDQFGAVIKSGDDATPVKVGIEKTGLKTFWVEVQDASGAVRVGDTS